MALLTGLEHPIVAAPMAGGPSTPQLVAAVSGAGGLGFLAAGYLSPDALSAQITATGAATDRPFGINLFLGGGTPADPDAVDAFARLLQPMAEATGVELGPPRFDDDGYEAKLEVVLDAHPAAVSFTFGCPTTDTVARLQGAGIEVWVTATDVDEASRAAAVGAEVVVVQGAEAGGHRGSFVDHDGEPLGLFPLLLAAHEALSLSAAAPALVAAGGLMTGADVEAALDAGAAAAQLGTAFLLCPEAGTSPAHRMALPKPTPTTLTRAFSGRRARSLVNAWTERVGDAAPSAYPEVHHLTSPLRAHGRAVGDPDLVNLWAGAGHTKARSLPAAELVAVLAAERGRARG